MNQWAVIWSVRDSFIAGLLATLELFITAAVVGFIAGIVLCYLTEYQKKTLNRLIIGFVSLMRAIPFLILAYLLYYGLPEVGISMEAWTAGLIALIIYHGAYFFEILRSQRRVFSGAISKPPSPRVFRVIKYSGELFCRISSHQHYRYWVTS